MQFKHKVELGNKLLKWYEENQRDLPWRQTDNPYHIWVSEVMLQQTQVQTVIPYYRAFIEEFPDIVSLAESDLTRLLKKWEGLGYYARARNLHQAASIILNKYNGRIPNSSEFFLALPGVGDYINAAVQSIAFGNPEATVDGNVKRVLARMLALDYPVNHSSSAKLYKKAADALLDEKQPGNFNQAMMELGALVCRPKNPDCKSCPVRNYCIAFKKDLVGQFPKRNTSPKRPTYRIAVGVIKKNDQFLIALRDQKGLLGGLWEFPGGKIKKNETSEKAVVREIKEETNLNVNVESLLTRVKHSYSHFKIEMDVYICSYRSGDISLNGPVDYRWIRWDEIAEYPFPKANHKFIPLLKSPAN